MPEPRGSLFLGDFHPHLETTFADRLRELAPLGVARELVVVVPNRFLAIHLRRRAAALGAPSLGLRVRALEDWIAELAQGGDSTEVSGSRERALPGWAAPILLSELLAGSWSQGSSDGYFSRVADKPGLYRALAGTLRDLRDAGISPDALAAVGERVFAHGSVEQRKLAEVLTAYRGFLALLRERRLLDDRAWSARAAAALRADPSLLPPRIWVYGFYDLVARQRELLELAFTGRRVDAYFPWGCDGAAFRFARPLRRWLEGQGLAPQELFATGDVPPSEAPGSAAGASAARVSAVGGAGLARLRAGLFSTVTEGSPDGAGEGPNSKSVEESAEDRSVRLISLPDPARQAAEVVRGLVADPPASAAVLLRQEASSLPYYLSLTHLCDAQLHLPAGEPWRRVPVARALATFLTLARAVRGDHQPPSLPRAAIEDLLGTGALAPDRFDPQSHPARWPQLLRRLGLVSELAGWQRLVDRHAPAPESIDEGEGTEEAGEPAAGTTAGAAEETASDSSDESDPDDIAQRLERELREELPALAGWVRELLAALTRLGADVRSWKTFARRVWRFAERWLAAGAERADLLEALLPLAELDGVLRPSLGLGVEVVEQLLSGGRRRGPRFGAAPTVGDLMSLRGVTFDRVVLPDLVERAFPRRPRQDPILLDAERAALNKAWRQDTGSGIEAPGVALRMPLKVAEAASEEKLLFRLAIAAARRQLLLTWPRSGEDGRSLVPSTYLLEVQSRLEAGLGGRVEVIPLAPPYPEELGAAGTTVTPPLAAWEFDLAAVDTVLERRDSGELSYLLAAYPRFADSLKMQEHRWGFATQHRLTEYDGMIGARLGKAWLAARTRPANRGGAVELSASALERFAHCSFRFFHRDVLGLRSEGPPERRLDQDPRQLGQIAHALLHALFEELGQQSLLPVTGETLFAATALVEPLLDRLVAEHPSWTEEGPEVLWQARRQRLIEDLRRVLLEEVREDVDDGERWRPIAYEMGFGGRSRDGEVGEPTAELVFDSQRGAHQGEHRVALRGRIDRVDQGGRGAYRVIDYKTGRLQPKEYQPGDLRGGERLQIALYARALPELLPAAHRNAVHGAYVGVTSASGYARYGWTPEHLEESARELDGLVAAMLESMGRGEMAQVENHYFCDNLCELSSLCGPGRRRLIEDKGLDPRVAAGWRTTDFRAEAPTETADGSHE